MNSIPGVSHNASLLLFTLIAVVGLIVLIARFKVNSIVAIVLAALFIGLTSGMELPAIMKRFQEKLAKFGARSANAASTMRASDMSVEL